MEKSDSYFIILNILHISIFSSNMLRGRWRMVACQHAGNTFTLHCDIDGRVARVYQCVGAAAAEMYDDRREREASVFPTANCK